MLPNTAPPSISSPPPRNAQLNPPPVPHVPAVIPSSSQHPRPTPSRGPRNEPVGIDRPGDLGILPPYRSESITPPGYEEYYAPEAAQPEVVQPEVVQPEVGWPGVVHDAAVELPGAVTDIIDALGLSPQQREIAISAFNYDIADLSQILREATLSDEHTDLIMALVTESFSGHFRWSD
jgi:hypothetical protein